MGGCSIEGCTRPHAGRGLCNTHYERWRKHGDPTVVLKGGRPFSTKVCSVEGCGRPHKSRGFCELHYQRWKKTGDPLGILPMGRPLMDRFCEKWELSDGHWLWTGSISKSGYGEINVDGRSQWAHRVGYELFREPISKGMALHHRCGVTHCVNPAHLVPMTPSDHARLHGGGHAH